MTKTEGELLKQLDFLYRHKRIDDMGRLQNKMVKLINKANLPFQDALMVLAVLRRQLEDGFIKRTQAVEKKNGSGVEKADV